MNTELKTYKDKNNNTIVLECKHLSVQITKKNRYWVAYNPHFKAYGHSKKDENDAIEDLRESLKIFFTVHTERGTLERAINKLGWKKSNDTYQKPKRFNYPSTVEQGVAQKLVAI